MKRSRLLWRLALILLQSALFLALTAPLNANEIPTNPPATGIKPQTPVLPPVKQFDAQKLESFRNDPDFRYTEKPYAPTLFTRFMQWLGSILRDLFSFSAQHDTYRLLKFLLVAAFIILLVSTLLNVKITDLFFRKPVAKSIPAHEFFEENIHQLNFEQLIAEALQNQDFRKAVRLLYLQNLKLLSDKSLINWQPNKTNRDYQYELHETGFYTLFAQITRVFNYVWYGNFTLDAQHFATVNQLFSNFSNQLNQQGK